MQCWMVILYISVTNANKFMTIQADFQRNKNNHPVWDLSNASNGKALILQEGRSLSLNFCLRRQTAVMVQDFRFSNGNRSETVLVNIDRILMGIFQTPASINRDWNNFMSTGQFPRIPRLQIGWHHITVFDCFLCFCLESIFNSMNSMFRKQTTIQTIY